MYTIMASAFIAVQIGQCGNQVGSEFFKLAVENKIENKLSPYLYPNNECRAVCVDTEPKVVDVIKSNSSYAERNLVCGMFGRGSNFAMGFNYQEYFGYRNESSLIETAMERINKECERLDCFAGCLMFHSLAGGTGSGLGSRISLELKDMLPKCHLLSNVVAPHFVGDNPLQAYNSLHCIHHISSVCDQILLFQNDIILHQCKKVNANMAHLNRKIALSILGLLLPTDSILPTKASYGAIGMEPLDLCRAVCPTPDLNITRSDFASHSSEWSKIFATLGNEFKSSSIGNISAFTNHRTISGVCSLRGSNAHNLASRHKDVFQQLPHLKFVYWNSYPLDIWYTESPICNGAPYKKSVSICANSSTVVDYLDQVFSISKMKFDQRAYLHWYQKFGVEVEDFDESFESCQRIINSYKDAVS